MALAIFVPWNKSYMLPAYIKSAIGCLFTVVVLRLWCTRYVTIKVCLSWHRHNADFTVQEPGAPPWPIVYKDWVGKHCWEDKFHDKQPKWKPKGQRSKWIEVNRLQEPGIYYLMTDLKQRFSPTLHGQYPLLHDCKQYGRQDAWFKLKLVCFLVMSLFLIMRAEP